MKKLLFILFFCPFWAFSQENNGTRLKGKILDEDNKGIEGVKIELHNKPIPAKSSEYPQGAFEIPTLNMPIEDRIFLKIEKKGYFLVDAFDGNLFEVTPQMRKTGYVTIKMRKVPQLSEKPRLVLLPFCNFTEENNPILVNAFVAPIRRGLNEVDTSKIHIVPYSLVKYAMQKHNLTPQDYCDMPKVFAVGQELRANIVVIGGYQFHDNRLNINCEFTDIIQQRDFKDPIFISKPQDQLPQVQDELTNEIVKRFGIKIIAQESERMSSWTSESTKNKDAYISYANGLQELDDQKPDKAEEQFKNSLEIDKQNARAWQEQAQAQTQQNKTQEATKSLENAEKIAENKPEATKISLWKKIGQLFVKNQQPQKAAKIFKQIKTVQPDFQIPTETTVADTFQVSSTKKLPNGLELILVQGGSFEMGSNDGGSDEKPVHEVSLSDFWIGKTEVTNAQFAQFLNEYGSEKVKNGEFKDQTMIYEHAWGVKKIASTWTAQSGYENHPVIYVTWYGANEFCKYYGGSLPSEAQWEYAARGGNPTQTLPKGEGFKYAGSNNIDEVAWYDKNSYDLGKGHKDYGTHVVAQKKPNELGLYDMSGNVWEWCLDWYDEKFYESADARVKNPINNRAKNSRLLRGGSWSGYDNNSRLANRDYGYPDGRSVNDGFRFFQVP